MRPGKFLPLLCVLFSLCAACGISRTASTPVNFYTLEYESPRLEDETVLPYVVLVKRFAVAPDYNMLPIIYRDKAFTRNTYTYHKWRSNPGDIATFFLARDFKNQGLYQAVLSYNSGLIKTHSLEGVVVEFYERDSDEGWEAILSLDVTLVREREPDSSRQVMFQKQYSVAQKADQQNPEAIARAMSQAMAQVSSQVMEDVYAVLSAQSKPNK